MLCHPPHICCVVWAFIVLSLCLSCYVVPGGGCLDLLVLVNLSDMAPYPFVVVSEHRWVSSGTYFATHSSSSSSSTVGARP